MLLRVEGMLNYRDEQYQQRGERTLDNELTLPAETTTLGSLNRPRMLALQVRFSFPGL